MKIESNKAVTIKVTDIGNNSDSTVSESAIDISTSSAVKSKEEYDNDKGTAGESYKNDEKTSDLENKNE